MPLPTIANVTRCAIRGTMPSGQRWVNVYHMLFSGSPPPLTADFTALTAKFLRLYTGTAYAGGQKVSQHWPAATTIDDVTYTPLDGVSPSQVQLFGVAGAEAAEALPSEVALCMTLRTALRGRSHRGRIYLGGFTEALNTTGGIVAAADLTGITLQMEGFRADLSTVSWQWVVASYLLSTSSPVISITSNNKWDVQRGRK
jgi:hypothetical protein